MAGVWLGPAGGVRGEVKIAEGGRRKLNLYGDEEEAVVEFVSGAKVEEDEKEETGEAGEGTSDETS